MKHLLIIDDDTRFLNLMKDFLEERGYQLSRAANGKQGIEIVNRLGRESRPPDLILCDVMMPLMDGYEFVRTLRAIAGRKLLPVIFLSAKGELNDRIQGLKEGGDAYLVKPFEPDELLALTEALLRRSEHGQVSGSGQEEGHNLGHPAIAIQFDVELTKTEIRVLNYVARGLSNKDIAKELCLSPRTIESHVSNMLQKTMLMNRTLLARWAIESKHI